MLRKQLYLSLIIAISTVVFAAPVIAERGLEVTDVSLNSQSSREISVRPGNRVMGTITLSTSSHSLFKEHTGVWIPSWQRTDRSAMRTFLRTFMGGVPNVQVNIDIIAPSQPGTYYLLFSFDKKDENAMFDEVTARPNETIFNNGRAVRLIVDFSAPEAARPLSKGTAMSLALGGPGVQGTAGRGEGKEYWSKVNTGSLDSSRDEAVRFRLSSLDRFVDLDLEIVDGEGRRRGFTGEEGRGEELVYVRVKPNETLYANVFAFNKREQAQFQLNAEAVRLSNVISDPSKGTSKNVKDGFLGKGFAGAGWERSQWYKVATTQKGTIAVEIRGSQPESDIDVWIYDDIGNVVGKSRSAGSAKESVVVRDLNPGNYYVRVSAFRASDESRFDIEVYLRDIPRKTSTTENKEEKPKASSSDSKTLPVRWTAEKGNSFTGFFKVDKEEDFLVEVFTGWGDLGKVDSIKVQSPSQKTLWEITAEGRGWEAKKIATSGPGFYRLTITYNGSGKRRGRIDASGLKDRTFYATTSGSSNKGDISDDERKILSDLYKIMLSTGDEGVSDEEQELMEKMEEYFSSN